MDEEMYKDHNRQNGEVENLVAKHFSPGDSWIRSKERRWNPCKCVEQIEGNGRRKEENVTSEREPESSSLRLRNQEVIRNWWDNEIGRAEESSIRRTRFKTRERIVYADRDRGSQTAEILAAIITVFYCGDESLPFVRGTTVQNAEVSESCTWQVDLKPVSLRSVSSNHG